MTQRGLMAGAAMICSLTLAGTGTAAAGARGAEDAGYERARAAAGGPATGVQSARGPVSCPPRGNCAAAGLASLPDSTETSFAISERNGRWGPAPRLAPCTSDHRDCPACCSIAVCRGSDVPSGHACDACEYLLGHLDTGISSLQPGRIRRASPSPGTRPPGHRPGPLPRCRRIRRRRAPGAGRTGAATDMAGASVSRVVRPAGAADR